MRVIDGLSFPPDGVDESCAVDGEGPGRDWSVFMLSSKDCAAARARVARFALALALAGSLLACGGGGGSSGASAAPSDAVFPVRISADRRTLVDAAGTPFPILGRTAWFLTSLPRDDYRLFIDDSVAKGFNSIEFHVTNHSPDGENAPFDGRGELPFLRKLDGLAWNGSLEYLDVDSESPDHTTPNETYWSYVDEILAYAESKGVLCFMFPAYVGFPGSPHGWMDEMVANGPARMEAYGVWIATRYRDRANLVWMIGGDQQVYDPQEKAVEAALIRGLKSVSGQRSREYSQEWSRNSIGTDQPDFGSEVTLNGTYSDSFEVAIQGRRAYAYSPTLPAYLQEQPFDEEGSDGNSYNLDATQPVRRFQWWGQLSNVGGYIAGNGYIWPFKPGWKAHLDTQGARDMARLNAFVRGIAWHRLVPSGLGGMRTLVTEGGFTPDSTRYVAAAATPDGTLLVAYVPPSHFGTITIDMEAMSGTVRARWFNPTTADSIEVGDVPAIGTHVFQPPDDNGSGYDDWVLLLEKRV